MKKEKLAGVERRSVMQDGGTGPATLRYSGSSTLTLNNSGNTYSGGTQLTAAALRFYDLLLRHDRRPNSRDIISLEDWINWIEP